MMDLPFIIKIISSIHEDYADAFQAETSADVEEEANDWHDNEGMRRFVLCVKIINGVEQQCNDQERYEKYKELRDIYMNKFEGISKTNPLEYFKNNITTGDEYTFLNYPIQVHKKFYPILKGVDDYIKNSYGDAVYNRVATKYHRLVGAFTIRYLNNGSAADSDVSPHGLGLAVDIDPKKNPQVIYSERPLVFFLLKRVTGKNFNKGATIVSGGDTKIAHNSFVNAFKNTTIEQFCDPNIFSDIQNYNSTFPTYSLAELNNDAIKISIEDLKGTLNRMKLLMQDNSQKNNISILSETINNKIVSIKYDLDKTENIIKKTFNTIIFSVSGKAAIAYIDETYIENVKKQLSDLEVVITALNSELVKPQPSFAKVNLEPFLQHDFSISKSKSEGFTSEYISFMNDLKNINSNYVNLSVYASALKAQVKGIGFNNVLLEDGFCDLEESILEGILVDAIKESTEWGGHYDSKKDWMHFGINGRSYSEFIND